MRGWGRSTYKFTLFGPPGGPSAQRRQSTKLCSHLAKKHHRKGTAWLARGPLRIGWGPWRVRTIWLGRLGASWKEDKQGVRTGGQAESTARSQLSWLPAQPSSQLVLKVGQVLSILVGASHPTLSSSALIASELVRPASTLYVSVGSPGSTGLS